MVAEKKQNLIKIFTFDKWHIFIRKKYFHSINGIFLFAKKYFHSINGIFLFAKNIFIR